MCGNKKRGRKFQTKILLKVKCIIIIISISYCIPLGKTHSIMQKAYRNNNKDFITVLFMLFENRFMRTNTQLFPESRKLHVVLTASEGHGNCSDELT